MKNLFRPSLPSVNFRVLSFASLACFAVSLFCLAADITVGLSLKVDKVSSALQSSVKINDLEITQSGSVISDVTQLIPTTKTNVNISAQHVTLGWAFIRNLDSTNDVVYGVDGDAPWGRLKPLEACLFRLDTTVTNISCKAITNSVWIRCWVLEN